MDTQLSKMKRDLSLSTQKGYPILLSGSLFFLILALASLVLPRTTLDLLWIFGLGVIFPLGLLLGKLLRIDLLSNNNPLAKLGGIAGGAQAFFIPVFIIVYQLNPDWLPFTVGLLGASHFLPYYWLYDSKAYLFLVMATGLLSFIAGGYFQSSAFFVVPLGIALIYGLTVWLLRKEVASLKQT